jgi:hypothetical protein
MEIAEHQPEIRKQIRENIAKICASMDCEIEAQATIFAEWWSKILTAHCTQAANGELNPPLPQDGSLARRL